jgi:hypothetical protein
MEETPLLTVLRRLVEATETGKQGQEIAEAVVAVVGITPLLQAQEVKAETGVVVIRKTLTGTAVAVAQALTEEELPHMLVVMVVLGSLCLERLEEAAEAVVRQMPAFNLRVPADQVGVALEAVLAGQREMEPMHLAVAEAVVIKIITRQELQVAPALSLSDTEYHRNFQCNIHMKSQS